MNGKCSVCKKEDVSITNAMICDCNGFIRHVKNICPECWDEINKIADVLEE